VSWKQILNALSRARLGIATIALTHVLSIVIGAVMVHAGSQFALDYRDGLIARARATSPALIAFREDNRLEAALWDFGGNLFAGVANTAGGMGVIFSYPIVAYRGWIGGIVSVDSQHASRFSTLSEALYYLTTLTLQLIPYSLAVGVGVNLGISYFRPLPYYQGDKWFGFPKEALRDVLRVYVLVVPLFLVASLWEFFLR
jgi:uncharacterized membrane protein SpoIIM required for sporulation